jgi:hypothetical protein
MGVQFSIQGGQFSIRGGAGDQMSWVGGSIYHGYIFFCVSVVNISFLGKQINIT